MKIEKLFLPIVLLFLIIIIILQVTYNKKPVYSEASYASHNLVTLNGPWELYWGELLEPKESDFNNYPKTFINLPIELTALSINNQSINYNGYATLRLNIKVDDIAQVYGLKGNYLSSANKIWVNGEPLVSNGNVTKSKEAYAPYYFPLEVFFTTETENIEIVIQIANYHHRRIRLREIHFGPINKIIQYSSYNIIKEGIIFGSLLLITFYYFVLYFYQKREYSLITLALISLIIALRVSIVNERVLVRIFPNIHPELLMKLGYLSAFLLIPLLIIYINKIFKMGKPNENKYIAYFCLAVFIMIALTNVRVYDFIFEYGSFLFVIWGTYKLCILVKTGITNNIRGFHIMLTGGLVILYSGLNDILRELTFINTPELLSIGIVFFMILQSIFLAWQFKDEYERASALSIENDRILIQLERLNKDVEGKIAERTKALEISNSKLKALSNIDPLTELGNRRYFKEKLEKEWNASIQTNRILSIIMLDIDYFKQFNDTYGHLEGDNCLKAIAKTLKSIVRQHKGIGARYGGEEFVILLSNSNYDQSKIIAEEIRHSILSLKIPHETSTVSDYVTVSLGIHSNIITSKDTMSSFINKADRSLYYAKESGRNRSC
ncbi:diguanylate cyclase (GGDEF)-like protein [Natranaerovirga pectinivora]|uniref:Diguanylate cyclase (GGDEF)-like protein n=1 Tax=Natranaerovirga pectinivora TaxID=682400 RepID=A0A4R3MQC0_9FIRM|nr:diguanylate cyclase [Natranaerovirga pectinivora]TCT16066.1 diguanylate cyclase (GGDEF)-like protein [Natranaerovirga pectinivora]